MINFNNEIFTRFIKFGTLSTEREREKISEIINEWNFVPLEKSNIEKKYLDTINNFISDVNINSVLLTQPHLKNEFIKQLFSLLEKIDLEIENKPSFVSEEKLIEKFDIIEISNYEEASKIYNKSKLLTKNTIEKYEFQYKAEIDNQLNIIEKKILKSYKNVHSKISKKWAKLIQKQNKTSIAIQLQKLGKPSEEDELKAVFDKLSIPQFKKLWSKNNLTKNFLRKKYLRRNFDLNEFQNEFDNIKNLKFESDDAYFHKIKSKFIEDWQKDLSIEKLQQDIKIIDKTRKLFLEKLYDKIEELKDLLKLLAPFISETTDLGRLWDMSAGNWQKVNFNLIEEYAEMLKEKKEILELAEILGKYRTAEAALEEEEFENIETVSKFRIEHSGKSELIGITESDDLNNLLPTELALFSDIETESIFYKRFAEKKLQTFRYVNKENYFENKSTTDKRKKEIEKDKGPFIIAVDTSGSMNGQPEFLAKIIAFAITKIALSEKRKAYLISFSTGIKTFELTDLQNSLSKLIGFLQMSFQGGTDASAAVLEALKQMKTEHYEKADLLLISDGVFANLSSTTLKSIEELKKKGNKFNALMIGSSYNEKALSFSDNVWQYDSNRQNLKDLVTIIKKDICK